MQFHRRIEVIQFSHTQLQQLGSGYVERVQLFQEKMEIQVKFEMYLQISPSKG